MFEDLHGRVLAPLSPGRVLPHDAKQSDPPQSRLTTGVVDRVVLVQLCKWPSFYDVTEMRDNWHLEQLQTSTERSWAMHPGVLAVSTSSKCSLSTSRPCGQSDPTGSPRRDHIARTFRHQASCIPVSLPPKLPDSRLWALCRQGRVVEHIQNSLE